MNSHTEKGAKKRRRKKKEKSINELYAVLEHRTIHNIRFFYDHFLWIGYISHSVHSMDRHLNGIERVVLRCVVCRFSFIEKSIYCRMI